MNDISTAGCGKTSTVDHAPGSPGITWRLACTFSILALLTVAALTTTEWPFTGPAGTIAEAILRFAVWSFAFALCALSIYCGAVALKRSRRHGDRTGGRLSWLALLTAVVVMLLIYFKYRKS